MNLSWINALFALALGVLVGFIVLMIGLWMEKLRERSTDSDGA